MTFPYESKRIPVADGLSIEARIFGPQASDRNAVLCLHGLTRNAADFDDIAETLSSNGLRVIALTMRGRGASDRDPEWRNYKVEIYIHDVKKAIHALNIGPAIFLGTSLGGIITMRMNELHPELVKAVILNDVGPELAPKGLARIAGYVGKTAGVANSLEDAAAQIRAINEIAFPDLDSAGWLEFARRTFRLDEDGKWRLDYDPKIADALAHNGSGADLWPAFATLQKKPTLIIRGAHSDLLSPEIVSDMRAVHDAFKFVEIPNRGHAPALNESEAIRAISSFLADLG
ncbi:MAG: alpha/beta hydrolase [Pseudomonadota bacterium]